MRSSDVAVIFVIAIGYNVDLHFCDNVDVIIAFIIQQTDTSNTFVAFIAFTSPINIAVDAKVASFVPFFFRRRRQYP